MAKMFYTLEEASAKLHKSEEEVRSLVETGRIQEFRDRDKLMFKVEQIDLVAEQEGVSSDDEEISISASDMSGMIPLAGASGGNTPGDSIGLEASGAQSAVGDELDLGAISGFGVDDDAAAASGSGSGVKSGSAEPLSLEESSEPDLSESGSSLADPTAGDSKHKTGVSIFDADELDQADPSAATLVTDDGGASGGFDLDPVGSGSGLLELTRESDDTSLGAEDFLEELGAGDSGAAMPSAAASGAPPAAGEALFEGDEAFTPAAVGAVVVSEPFDGPGSGLAGGLAFGAVLALAMALAVVITGMMGVSATDGVFEMIATNLLAVVGGLAVVTLIATLIGWALGKRAG